MIDPRSAVAARDLGDVWRFAEAAAAIGLCGVKSPEDAYIRMTFGMELGMTAMAAMRNIFNIDGRPGVYADAIVGLCQQRTEICEYVRLIESNERVATYAAKRVGQPEVVLSYTIEQAKAAGLTGKKNWANPIPMLRARASAAICRIVFADITAGLYGPDEVAEINTYSRNDRASDHSPRVTVERVVQAVPAAAPAPSAPKPYRGEETLTKLRKALDAARDSARVDSVSEHSEKARAELNAEDAGVAIGLFADTRARIEAAQDAQAAAQ